MHGFSLGIYIIPSEAKPWAPADSPCLTNPPPSSDLLERSSGDGSGGGGEGGGEGQHYR